jgi:hypothetical protein
VIAERVREDVLALAPPPPPAPGARPAPPVRIAIAGADDAAVQRLARRVAKRLGALGPTLVLGETVLVGEEGGLRETTAPVPARRARLRLALLSRLPWIRHPFRGQRMAELVERASVNEVLDQGSEWRFVVEERSPLVEWLARADAEQPGDGLGEAELGRRLQYLTGLKKIPLSQWWRYLRQAPEIWLVSALELVRSPMPSLLVHVAAPSTQTDERLRRAHAAVGAVLRRRGRVGLLEVDPGRDGEEAAAAAVDAACRRLAQSSAATAGRG